MINKPHTLRAKLFAIVLILLTPTAGMAASLNGESLSVFWALPFIGLLLSIALLPLFASHAWHHHQGKITALWSSSILIPLVVLFGMNAAAQTIAHVVILEYLPFIIILGTLFTLASGIVVRGNIHGSPLVNVGLLSIGAFLASFIGTTGASMVMIRPMIRANDQRNHKAHVFVFFIFMVSNIGGSLTPLGDPPLFLGFLKGVDFFWTTQNLWKETLLVSAIVLAIFFGIDSYYMRKETYEHHKPDPTPNSKIRIAGVLNMGLILLVLAVILLSSSYQKEHQQFISILEQKVPVGFLIRDCALLIICAISLKFTPRIYHSENEFSWDPILEVAKLFAGIFICMAPVLLMLQAGSNGAFAPLVALTTNAAGQPDNLAYFWLTGALSSFLDNAPTYLVFFNLAGGDATQLMGPLAQTLAAISLGSVFMGANSYIGNAPNFMVKSIVESRGITMPSFFGYMAWSCAILLPVYALVGWLFFG